MKKIISLLVLFFLAGFVSAQNPSTPNLPKDVKVEGTTVGMTSRQPQNNELIIFKSQKNGNEFQVISDSLGKFNTRLPVADKYEIFITGFKDSTSYNIIEIPAPRPNGFYNNAFTVNLEFEPS